MSKTCEHNPQEHAPQSEVTPGGVQTLVPGVAPVSLRARLDVMARKPVTPKRGPILQKPCDIGLGACPRAGLWPDPGNEAARNQLDLIDAIRRPENLSPTPTEKE